MEIMYKCFIILVILIFSSCNKQHRYTNEGNETVSIVNNEKSLQKDTSYDVNFYEENAIRPDVVSIANRDNFPLENIIGT
jgi:hypothetical protein